MGKFDGILLCTDLDGTLYKNDKTVSEENIRAIEYFKSEGGYFTFVTGRMPYYISDIYDMTKPNAPIGCINGGGLYDYPNKRYIWNCAAADGVLELVSCVEREVPGIGIQVNTFYNTFFCKENDATVRFRARTGLPLLKCDYNEIKEPIAKIHFLSLSEEDIQKAADVLSSHPLSDRFDFIRSEKTIYEILPKGIGKGRSIEKLTEYLGLDPRKTVAVGDYDNDISMIRAAGVGIAVSNASQNTLAAADYITVSNEEHAIARVISDIEEGKYNI